MTGGESCHTPFGDFRLGRYPARRDEPLQAWSAADLLLLEEIHRRGIPGPDILVVNDEHGALCVALEPRELWTDSALATLALNNNLERNQRARVPVTWSTEQPNAGAALVALRIPKQLPYFQYQLAVLSRLIEPGTTVLAAGMDKHLSPRVAALLEEYIGPTERHRGQRKARLFSARRDEREGPAAEPPASYYCETLAGELQALPNVFSQERLDGGSRLLLEQLQALEPATRVVDRLVNQELAERAPHAADRRGVLVRATRAGIARTEMLTQRSDAALGGVLEAFTVEEIDLLTDYLGQLAEAMDEWLTAAVRSTPWPAALSTSQPPRRRGPRRSCRSRSAAGRGRAR